MAAKPGGVSGAACEPPGAAHAVPALGRHRPALEACAPGEHRIRRPEHVASRVIVEECRGQGAAVGLAETPGGTRVGARNGLGHRRQHGKRLLVPADTCRQRQAGQLPLVQRFEHVGRQLALRLDRRRSLAEQWQQGAGPVEPELPG